MTESDGADGGAEEGLFPFEPKTFSVVFYGALALWVLYLLVTAMPWDWDDKLLPLVIGVPTASLIVIQLVRLRYSEVFDELFSVDDSSSTLEQLGGEIDIRSGEGRSKAERERYEVVMLAWVIALPVLLHLFGFGSVLPLYTLAFVYFFTGEPVRAIGIAFAFSLFVYLLFFAVLGMNLWEGILGVQDPLIELINDVT